MTSTGNSDNYLSISLIIGLTIIYVSTVTAELKLVSVLFRHGDRTPDNNGYEMYPNDPYLHYNFEPTGLGQLINKGKKREYKLGEVLRERYGNYLGKNFTPKSVSALSSDYDRTKMSLQLVLAALFPPSKSQRWNNLLNWQPVPANYLRRVNDNIFLADECPLFLHEYNRVVNSPEGVKKMAKHKDLINRLEPLTGKNMSKPLDLYYLYHTFMAEYSCGLRLPEWSNEIFPNGELFDTIVLAYELANYTPLLRRLYSGPYLKLVTENMLAFMNGTLKDPRKIYLYSGHETNIAAVLNAFKLYYPHVPQYSSSILLELHELNKSYYIKILHYKGIPAELTELRLADCEVLCPMEKYLQLIAEVIPSDDELICDKSLTRDFDNFRSPTEKSWRTYNLIKTARGSKSS